MSTQHVKDFLIPHRLRSVAAMNLATRYILVWGKPVPIEIYFDGKLSIDGLSTAFTNPTIEAGVIHCRALLEFMGLCLIKNDLANIESRRKDDVGIENYFNEFGSLSLVTPLAAISCYEGPDIEARQALISILRATNKGLAHFTTRIEDGMADIRLLEIASRGIEALMAKHFYDPLGLEPPDFSPQSRNRPLD